MLCHMQHGRLRGRVKNESLGRGGALNPRSDPLQRKLLNLIAVVSWLVQDSRDKGCCE